MTILLRLEQPGMDLTVCGTPDRAWLDWVRTAEVGLTEGQLMWRDIARRDHEQSCADRDGEATPS